MLRRCPNHGFDDQTQVHIFHNGLQQQPKLLLDATAGGSLMSKTPTEAIQIIESMIIRVNTTEVLKQKEESLSWAQMMLFLPKTNC